MPGSETVRARGAGREEKKGKLMRYITTVRVAFPSSLCVRTLSAYRHDLYQVEDRLNDWATMTRTVAERTVDSNDFLISVKCITIPKLIGRLSALIEKQSVLYRLA